ncbi:DUF4832 domain-containing protein [Arthrobacter sp. H35-D1]|uniref:DUF4832 domain-containing protein n=1 Tax=Arthrobacter sp. H35-D1 TaxID=3046202 RepID=UPI0024B88420|nr:DUF4832 domain-containing protein [Arthrobacter sp. H35-D1]MDJ0315312.1 hypothetical protein [Arthrobacter sp. H35-D1]
MHNLRELPADQWAPTLRWLGDLYRKSFSHVLLALNFAPGFSYADLDEQIAKGSIMRRDSLGSTLWFPQDQKNAIASRFPDTILVGENCYQNFTVRKTSCDHSFKVPGDKPYRPMLERVLTDAKNLHANYLDLRHPPDVTTWVVDNPDLVQDFAVNGGYRLAPNHVSIPTVLPEGAREATIASTWSNTGVGRMPNDNPQWNNKYKISYALLDQTTGEPVYQVQSTDENPGNWIKGTDGDDSTEFAPTDVPAGSYDFAVAIVDNTRENVPAIKLALTGEETTTGWNKLGTTKLEAAEATPTAEATSTDEATPTQSATPTESATPTSSATPAKWPTPTSATTPATSSSAPTAAGTGSDNGSHSGNDLAATGWERQGLWAGAAAFLLAGAVIMLVGRRRAGTHS